MTGVQTAVLATVRAGSWHWGLGDPSLGAVVVTVLYLVTSATCFVVARRFHRSATAGESSANVMVEYSIWYGLAMLLFALGVNKQADFQTLLTIYGRDILRSLDLYEQRRQIQQTFIAAVALAAAICAAGTVWFVRVTSWACRTAVVGFILQLCFVVVRAASFHNVDRLPGIRLPSIKLNLLFESFGLLIVLVSAICALQAGQRDVMHDPALSTSPPDCS